MERRGQPEGGSLLSPEDGVPGCQSQRGGRPPAPKQEGKEWGTKQRSIGAGKKIDLKEHALWLLSVHSHPGLCSLRAGVHTVPTGDKNFLRGILPRLQTSDVISDT